MVGEDRRSLGMKNPEKPLLSGFYTGEPATLADEATGGM